LRWLAYDNDAARGEAIYRVFPAQADGTEWVFARTCEAGTDRWGRPGNYLVHAYLIDAAALAVAHWRLVPILRSLPFQSVWEDNPDANSMLPLDLLTVPLIAEDFGRLHRLLRVPTRASSLLGIAEIVAERLLAGTHTQSVPPAALVGARAAEDRLDVVECLCLLLPYTARSRFSFSSLERGTRDRPMMLVCLPSTEGTSGEETIRLQSSEAGEAAGRSAYFAALGRALGLGGDRAGREAAATCVASVEAWLAANPGPVTLADIDLLTEFCSETSKEWELTRWQRLTELVRGLAWTSTVPPTWSDVIARAGTASSTWDLRQFAEAFRTILALPIDAPALDHEQVQRLAAWWTEAFSVRGLRSEIAGAVRDSLSQLASHASEALEQLVAVMRLQRGGPWSLAVGEGNLSACQDVGLLALELIGTQASDEKGQ
jgi:hypothetical protein